MHGFLSRDGLPPAELLSEGRREVLGYGVRLVDDLVTVVAPGAASRFEVHSATGGPLARGITVVEGAVPALATDDDQLRGVELGDGRFIPRAAVLVRPRMVPRTALLSVLGATMDESG